ncbi:deoxyribose-phosphate aldolase [Candidatus Enterococcus leclercqii]|uniref:deoxyribose-phosphate aldolase n=1 Tax=Candidatus Enterococcus leclercqii TaxID=1857218 RepID=UPI0013793D10|nr:deoxyribose-phosphate aldolase [Enterococcus sp. CU9D]KAF1292817.1 deoxyribose-phosphate aldolase [Enterococcus sp. CU9D]
MKVSELVSLRVVDPALKEWDLKDLMDEIRQTVGLQEIVVLPANLRRVKQLLSGTGIRIGAVVDYPLGCGTVAKKAFEVGRSFQDGADFLELSISSDMLLHQPAMIRELDMTLSPLAIAWGEIRTRVDSRELPELTKINLAAEMKRLGWSWLVLGEGADLETAKHDATTFEYDGGKQLRLQVNLETATQNELQELVLRGVNRVGLSSFGGLDLTVELHQLG